MFGVPSDLDLSFLVGAVLHQVHLMPYQLNLVFEPDARFFIEGVWELMASDGTEIDRYRPWPRTEPYQFHRLLGRKIVGWTVTSPISLSLRFDDGSVFRLFDSSTQYESFMIEPGCIIV